jgi:hypothetical protein
MHCMAPAFMAVEAEQYHSVEVDAKPCQARRRHPGRAHNTGMAKLMR